MCGAYFLQHSPALRAHFGIASPDDLKDFLGDGKDLDPKRLFASASAGTNSPMETRVFRPTDRVPFLAHDRHGQWTGFMATWWLALDRKGDTWRPNQRFATFNSRIDKVVSGGRSIHTMKPQSFRVVLPATGFVEWHNRQPHLFTRADGLAMLLGGMAKAYPTPEGHQYAVSIVTLPGHDKTRHIHEKSIPLLLDDTLMAHWLDRSLPHADFAYLLQPHIPVDLDIQPVSDLNRRESAGERQLVRAD